MTNTEALDKINPGDKFIFEGKKWIVTSRDSDGTWAACDDITQHFVTMSFITSVEFAIYAPAYKFGEPESVTRAQANKMWGKDWEFQARDNDDFWYDPTELSKIVCKIATIRSPGGNVYKVEG